MGLHEGSNGEEPPFDFRKDSPKSIRDGVRRTLDAERLKKRTELEALIERRRVTYDILAGQSLDGRVIGKLDFRPFSRWIHQIMGWASSRYGSGLDIIKGISEDVSLAGCDTPERVVVFLEQMLGIQIHYSSSEIEQMILDGKISRIITGCRYHVEYDELSTGILVTSDGGFYYICISPAIKSMVILDGPVQLKPMPSRAL